LVLSQSTRVTDRQTDRQNYDSEERAIIAARAIKKRAKMCHLFILAKIICRSFPFVLFRAVRRRNVEFGEAEVGLWVVQRTKLNNVVLGRRFAMSVDVSVPR